MLAIKATIVTNESFNKANLLSLIIEGNVEGLKSLMTEIEAAIEANWDIYDNNIRIINALKAAGFGESDQCKQLRSINQDITGTNTAYNDLKYKASCAVDELK